MFDQVTNKVVVICSPMDKKTIYSKAILLDPIRGVVLAEKLMNPGEKIYSLYSIFHVLSLMLISVT